jgi:cell division protein FtsZ
LVLAFVTAPDRFEGEKANQAAVEGIVCLGAEVDNMIILSRDCLLELRAQHHGCNPFAIEEKTMSEGIAGVLEPLNVPGLLDPHPGDIERVMSIPGEGAMSIGEGRGDRPALEAAEAALRGPMSCARVGKAKGLVLYFRGNGDIPLQEYAEALELIAGEARQDADIVFAVSNPVEGLQMLHEGLCTRVRLTLIATGLEPTGGSSTPAWLRRYVWESRRRL